MNPPKKLETQFDLVGFEGGRALNRALKPFATQIEDALHRRIVVAAAQDRKLIQDIVDEAFRLWLSARNGKKKR